ncbi:MAG: tetratricopeptide repeat protein [Thiohalocapsa sp.]
MLKTLRVVTAFTLVLLTVALTAAEAPVATTDLISQGEQQLKENDIDGAIATLTTAVDQEPDSSLAHTRLAGAYLLGQRHGEAIDQFQQAISLDTNNAAAFIGMGIAYLHSGQFGAAKAALGGAKRLDPGKTEQIDELIARIDQRGAASPH